MKNEDLAAVEKRLIAEGKLIEAGWIGLRLAAVPPDAPAVQVEEMRNAFFAGAAHLYRTMMRVLDPGDEPTAADLERMSRIDGELEEFIKDFERKHFPAQGNG